MTERILNSDELNRVQRTVESDERRKQNGLPPRTKEYRAATDSYADGSIISGGDCACSFVDVGTRDCLGGINNAPTKFIINDLGIFGANVVLSYDSDCEYIGDEIVHDCGS